MARRGVFGRLPRQAPDLTNAIVALVREAQAMYDGNIVDAWKNGGKVDGKGVTDSRLLEHLRKRRDQLDPSDPQWDDWNNNYMQYDFAIEESKMALKNDEGKLSDAGMAQFYRKWAGRADVQKNSEFHRSLLSRAAKWQAAAKARSAGSARGSKYEAHNNWVKGYYKNNVQGAETANGYLLVIAKTYGAAPPNADSLDDIDPNSAAYGKFMDIIEDGKADDPNIQGLVDEMVAEIRKTNPDFTYSQSNLTDLLNRGDRGLKRLVQESMNDSERDSWMKRRETMRYEKTRIKQTAANERIQIAADSFALDLDACAGNPYCARNATKKFRDKLQGEVPNVVGGTGDITAMTQDVRTASALTNTIRQLNDVLAGKPISASPAAGAGEANPDYTIFDAAAGRDTPAGMLGMVGNGMNADKDKLDGGGWVMTEPITENGAPVLDGEGMPAYKYTIYDANTAKPQGAIAVPGTTLFSDETRTATGPEGPTPVTVTPVTYVNPSPPNIEFVDQNGNSLDANTASQVQLFDGDTAVPAPWVELRGVKGPDGKGRTVYRTGDGTPERPFLYHDQPPVAATMKPNVAGQHQMMVTMGTDAKGAPFPKADIASYVAGVAASRDKEPSGAFVLGTFASSGATSTSAAIAELYHSKSSNASIMANRYLRDFQRGIESLPLNDPERIRGQADYKQLSQVADLYAAGKADKMLNDAYSSLNQNTPEVSRAMQTLTAAGFTAGRYGEGEVARRISLLEGVDRAQATLNQRRAFLQSAGESPAGNRVFGGGTALAQLQREQEELARQRGNVLNPTISVSNIKVPGMPTMMQPSGAPTFLQQLFGDTFGQGRGLPYAPPALAAAPRAKVPTAPSTPPSGVVPTGTNVSGPTSTYTPPKPPTPKPPSTNPSVKPIDEPEPYIPPPPKVSPNEYAPKGPGGYSHR
jgi:hypothetical protein